MITTADRKNPLAASEPTDSKIDPPAADRSTVADPSGAESPDAGPSDASAARSGPPKWLALIGVVIVVAAAWYFFGDSLSADALAAQEQKLVDLRDNQPWLVYPAAFLVYVIATGLSIPGAAVLTILCGWLFKLFGGALVVSFASTAGATVAFLLSRYLFRDAIQAKFGDRLETFNAKLEEDGPFYLFSLRLVPAFPFFVVNLVMGLTPIKTWTYWWVSQLGMLPGTLVYVYLGSQLPSLKEYAENGLTVPPGVIVGFIALGLLPIVSKKVVEAIRRGRGDEVSPDGSADASAAEETA